MEEEGKAVEGRGNPLKQPMLKSLVVVCSYHHQNTEKIANAIARVLDAQTRTPQQTRPEELQEYDLIGLGSGIYDEKNHPELLDLADRLPRVADGKAFIFSTSGYAERSAVAGFHAPLRQKLQARGYTIVGEFNCPGHNTHSFLRWFGGLNKGRPNAGDLRRAEEFAQRLKRK
jgi:flavodoxin